MKTKFYYLLAIGLLIIQFIQAQDLNGLKGEKPVSFHGSVGAGMQFFNSNAPYQTRDPFSWNLYGSFTPSFYGYSLPFSFVVTQYTKSYTTPLSQFGISPTYKWVRLDLGYRSITFSPLVLAGQSFLGTGIELFPKGFYFGTFYGRLNKAIDEDTTNGRRFEPQYARKGYGVKIGVGSSAENFSLEFFHAKDDTGSIQRLHDSVTTILPQENSVLGSVWHFTFFKKLSFSGDAAVSLLNRDMSYQEIDSISNVKIPTVARSFHRINYSSVVSFSGEAQFYLMLKNLNASVGYRRVQPDFKSLGVPYMLNDIEMFNGNIGTGLAKGKVSINASFNTQHNNLSHKRSTTLVTRTGNLFLNTFLNQHLNINMNMTGVQVYQKDGLLKLNDSIRMDQFMFTSVLSPSFNFSNVIHQQTVSASIAYTNLNDHNPLTSPQTNGKNICASLNYGLFFVKDYRGINFNLTYSTYSQPKNKYNSLGFNLGGNAQLLKDHNLNLQAGVGYFLNHSTGIPAANNITFSFNCGYELHRHQSFSVYANYVITPPVNLNPLNKINEVPYAVNSKYLTGGITYAYHF